MRDGIKKRIKRDDVVENEGLAITLLGVVKKDLSRE